MIEQGQEIPYQESSSSGATTTQFKKAVLSLKVTPQITPDDRVVMDLAVTNDSQGTNVSTGVGAARVLDSGRRGARHLSCGITGSSLTCLHIDREHILTVLDRSAVRS